MFFKKHRKILKTGIRLLKKKSSSLTASEKISFENKLRSLDNSIINKQRKEARLLYKELKTFIKSHFPKTIFDHAKELLFAITFAIVFAFFIRQFWFELYQVPTGSMRPTVEELDRLVVSKTTFGLNIPFVKKPLFFSKNMIKRNGSIVFTVKDMDIPDSDTLYFYVIPGKKRYIKRCIGKPGDVLYFYGGLIYGVDKDGNEIQDLYNENYLKSIGIQHIDHVPYIYIDGKMEPHRSTITNVYERVICKQMNIPIGKMQLNRLGEINGEFYDGNTWKIDNPAELKTTHDKPVSYSDLWGIKNYATARLLKKEQAIAFYGKVPTSTDTELYLELKHTPNLTFPKPEMRRDYYGKVHPMITPFVTLIPLNHSHLEALQKAMYTARFYVKNGKAFLYQNGGARPQRSELDPKFPTVPDGLYEFYYGKAYKIQFDIIRSELDHNHPLCKFNTDLTRKLFNLGMEFNTVFDPVMANQPYVPQRFAYFRDGDLYIMGAPILKKDDATLIDFTKREMEKQKASSKEAPYIAFVDPGPPIKDGKLDKEFIYSFGLHVPNDGILALGDNYAMSADSRDFGFVPIYNLLGSPSFTYWPPCCRLGPFPQAHYPWITKSNLMVLSIILLSLATYYVYQYKQSRRSYFKN